MILLAPAMVFFMATWEEYYTGMLALPIVNGPNEGLAVMYSCYFFTAIHGPSFWLESNMLIPHLRNNQLFVIMTFILAIGQCVLSGKVSNSSLSIRFS